MSQELKLVREQLQSAQKYECVGALAAGVAHEFNNMMCSIMGFAELALDVKNTDNETLKESAEVSYETAKRASATAACLLAFSRQVKSSKAIGDVNDAIRGALRLLQRDLEKNGIKVDLSFGALPKSLYAQGPLQQVFVNLIINAWHAMMEVSGDRALSIKSWAEGNSRIYVSVSDTGPGIHPSKHEKIFEPFYTTKTSGKPNEGKGSGLGLVIVKEVVRDHNGTVRVESDEGKGACFTVTLPVDTGEIALNEERDSSATPADHPTGSRPYSILVVDDEEPSRRIINRLLQRQGHEVFTASNMAEALVLLWSQKLDLIVLDLVMPGSNGPDNVRQLRDQEIDLPILICTGNTDTTLIQRALDAGANGVVMKPFSIEEFSTHMYSCLAAGKKVSG
jgi:CheY-like chemotaxis protein